MDGTTLEGVLKSRAIGTDPGIHVQKWLDMFESEATIVNVPYGEPDQARVIDF